MKNIDQELKKQDLIKKKKKDFGQQLQEDHDKIIDLITDESEMKSKLIKLQSMIKIIHTRIKRNATEEYILEAEKIISNLKNNAFVDQEGNNLNIYSGEISQNARFNILIDWFTLIIEEMPQYSIEGNLKRVK